MKYDVQKIYGSWHKMVCCKGFRVQNARIYNTFRPEYADYWGGNTKDILNISRDSLSHQQSKKIKPYLKNPLYVLQKFTMKY